jgi:membrane fusion protein (multidrug efflux system)
MWLQSKTHIKTDNAFIEAHIHSVSARVPGTVTKVTVRDNQLVKQGELLVELDQADYQAQVSYAAAQLAMAGNETSGEYAQVEGAKASVNQARARLDQAELDLQRGNALFKKEVISKEQLDRLATARRVVESQLREAEEAQRRAQAVVGLSGKGGNEARLAQRRAQLEQARLNLSYTRLYAPADGFITRKSVEPGNNLQAGQPLLALVALEDPWVTANYKESQLTHVRPGQSVEFKVDAYPGLVFKGTVESIMAGTGAAFSMLPPENASGNYVKVVQRIPVKIVIDQSSDPQHLLRVGMSIVPTILTKRSIGTILNDLNPF